MNILQELKHSFKHMSLFAKYYCGTMGYNVIDKTMQLWDAKVEVYALNDSSKREYVMKPMLIGDKIGVLMYTTLVAPFTFPFMFFQKLNSLDMLVKGEKPENYGYVPKKHVIDYCFSTE